MSMSSALRRAMRDRAGPPRDAAAEGLALHYARLIDQAAPAAKYRKHLRALAGALARYGGADRDDALEALDALTVALGEHTVASDLGPKLLGVLVGLGLAGRPAGKDDPREQQQQPANPLEAIRDEVAQQRAKHAR